MAEKSPQEFIRQGELDSALEALSNYFLVMDDRKDIMNVLGSRLAELKKSENQGVTDSREVNQERNQIALALLRISSELEANFTEIFPTVTVPVSFVDLEEHLQMIFNDHFDDIKKIYTGHSAILFKGVDDNTNRKVVIRVFKEFNTDTDKPSNDQEAQEREKETQILNTVLSLRHRNITNILTANLKDFPRYLVLEYIKGISLNRLIGRVSFSNYRILCLFRGLCDAVYYLHINGIAHKKIKPNKIIIDTELQPIISPLEIIGTKQDDFSELLYPKHLPYASPEFLKGDIETPDFKSDQFSLGVIAYELITGKPLFGSANPKKKNVSTQRIFEKRTEFLGVKKVRKKKISSLQVPPTFQRIIDKMLQEDPADRFDSLKDVLKAIDKVKINLDENVEACLNSYERCSINNSDFTTDFYAKLGGPSDYQETIQKIFLNHGISLEPHITDENLKAPPQRSLRVAIELIIQSNQESEKIKEILAIDAHKGLDPQLYKFFIDTLIACVAEDDYQWQRYEKNHTKNPIREAWHYVRDKSMEVIQEYFKQNEK